MATERHLWINLAEIGKKKKQFIFDLPVSPSVLINSERHGRGQQLIKNVYHAVLGFCLKPRGTLAHLRLWTKSVATPAPHPPSGRRRTQKRKDMRRNGKNLREVIEPKRVGGPPHAKGK